MLQYNRGTIVSVFLSQGHPLFRISDIYICILSFLSYIDKPDNLAADPIQPRIDFTPKLVTFNVFDVQDGLNSVKNANQDHETQLSFSHSRQQTNVFVIVTFENGEKINIFPSSE